MQNIDRSLVESALSYQAYRQLINHLLLENKTTGNNHSETMLHYTTMNVVRMERLDRTPPLLEETHTQLRQLKRPLLWLVLTEAWCGDAAQVLPVLQRMAEQQPLIELRLLLRDEHPELMNAFLTEGARAIPKLIVFDGGSLELLGSWGPRPEGAQQLMRDYKKELAQLTDEGQRRQRYQEHSKNLQKWYTVDKTRSIQQEIIDLLIRIAQAQEPVKEMR